MKRMLSLTFTLIVGFVLIALFSIPAKAQEPQPPPWYGAGNPTPMGEGCYNGGQPPLCEDPVAVVPPSTGATNSGSNSGSGQSNQSTGNSTVQATAVPGPVACATTAIKIRESASLASKKVGSLARGACLPLAGEMVNGFYPVSYNGGTAYVSGRFSNIVK